MAEKRIVVPEEMLKAVDEAIGKARREKSARPGVIGGDAELWPNEIKNISIKAALRWQTENPPVPTRKQMRKWQRLIETILFYGIGSVAVLILRLSVPSGSAACTTSLRRKDALSIRHCWILELLSLTIGYVLSAREFMRPS